MLKLGAKKKLVKQQIQKKFGKMTTLKDIQNVHDQAKKMSSLVERMHKYVWTSFPTPCIKTRRQLVKLLWMMKTICPFFTFDLA